MDERILNYIDNLKKELEGLPEDEVKEAVNFYEEYLNDAMEAGKNPDEVIKELDPPVGTAAMIKAETSIMKAQHNPGLRNFIRALKNAFGIVSTPMSVFSLSIVELFSYCMVAMLFGGAFAAVLGGAACVIVFLYEAVRMPLGFGLEIAGTIGFSLFSAGVCAILAVYLYRWGMLFIKFSTNLVRLIMVKSGRKIPEMRNEKPDGKPKRGKTVPVLLVTIAAGILLFGISGLPQRIFTITNSMKPEGMVKNITLEYDPGLVNRISAVTTNSVIKISRGSGDKIILSYEEADWLDYDIKNNGGTLDFTEKSNGRLPLFSLLSLHEGCTELAISLPESFMPDAINLESTGGHIFIYDSKYSLDAKTTNGSINLVGTVGGDGCNINASTKTGRIFIDSVQTFEKAGEGTEYHKDMESKFNINVSSINGNINIRN